MPDSAELASQIKALRAEQQVDAAPQRVARTRVTAEEAVTTRIRKRTQPEIADPLSPERFRARISVASSAFRR